MAVFFAVIVEKDTWRARKGVYWYFMFTYNNKDYILIDPWLVIIIKLDSVGVGNVNNVTVNMVFSNM